MILGNNDTQRVDNHPVHIIDEDGRISPSALIPFCEFGGNMSIMGTKIEGFQAPVCNSFRPKIFDGQLCYEVDPEIYRSNISDNSILGLSLLISFNEDRQYTIHRRRNGGKKKEKPMTLEIESEEQNGLYIGTISNHILRRQFYIYAFRTPSFRIRKTIQT